MCRVIFGAGAAFAVGIVLAAIVLLGAMAIDQAWLLVVSPPIATALTALCLVAGLIPAVALGMMIVRRGDKVPSPGKPSNSNDEIYGILAVQAGRELATVLRTHPYAGGVGSLILGFAIGASPDLRTSLRRMLLGN